MQKIAIIAVATTLFLVGCETPDSEQPQKPKQENKSKKKNPKEKKKKQSGKKIKNKQSPAIATAMLKKLKVAPEQRLGYDRDLFNHWTSQTGSCDTRDVVLARQDKKGRSCGSDRGLWISVYDGMRLTDSSDLDVDHMVPLAEAWDSGARAWPPARREAYANDLHPFSLIAVSAGSNREKSDQDPSEWLPESGFVCQYAARWIAVKFRWRLTIDNREKTTLIKIISQCPRPALKLSKNWTAAPVKAVKKESNGVSKKKVRKKFDKKKVGRDKLFSSCTKAKASGYGPYKKGRDPEYSHYRDADGDGRVCE